MQSEVVFDRRNGWLPKVIREEGELRLRFAGGADALHDPREFRIPLREDHLAVIRADLARHLILHSALQPLCRAAGTTGPLDEDAAVALLHPILLGTPSEVDVFLGRTPWDWATLAAYGADPDLLDDGQVVAALVDPREQPDWQRVRRLLADRERTRNGVQLSPLDGAVLEYTGQYVHASTIPRRLPDAVDPPLLPRVLEVIATAEEATAGLRIARDARRGVRGTDTADWTRMQDAVDAALRRAHPQLADAAARSVSFLVCSEAARRARDEPFDPEAVGLQGTVPPRELVLSDDTGVEQVWPPDAASSAVEAVWSFVAAHVGPENEIFSVEDRAGDQGIQLQLYASSLARVRAREEAERDGASVSWVEYGLAEDLAHYRALVRAFVAGGYDALDALTRWYADHDAFEEARAARAPR
jgi:hypothetical protein